MKSDVMALKPGFEQKSTTAPQQQAENGHPQHTQQQQRPSDCKIKAKQQQQQQPQM